MLRYVLANGWEVLIPYDLTHAALYVAELYTLPDGRVVGGTLASSGAEIAAAWRGERLLGASS